jgi:serine/threonine-protein kinase
MTPPSPGDLPPPRKRGAPPPTPPPRPAAARPAAPVAPKPPVAPAKPGAPAAAPPAPAASAPAAAPAVAPKPAAPRPSAPARPAKVESKAERLAKPPKRPAGEKDPLIGQTVARCRIEARIGEGRTSVVYRAMHEALNRPVAVKILLPEVLQFPDVVAKFEAEARAIAKIDHENILKIYDVSTEGGRHSIVMELLEGESLLDLVQREGKLPPVDAMRVIRQAALGLGAAHAKNIIHRDVKPQNLVLLDDGVVKVVDFGLATAADSDLAAVRIGTPHYMAPEACEAKPVEARSDVYSLGITLYHLLVGKPPYAGLSLKEILASHVEARPLHPERQVLSLPKALCDLVREMTKRDPLTRVDMADVVAGLDRIGGKELAVKQGLKTRRRRRGAKTPALAIGAVALGAIVVAVIVIASKGGSTPEAPAKPGGAGGGTPVAGVPPPDVATPPPDVLPPAPPPESPEQRAAREAREAKTAQDQRRADAERAMNEAEEFARANWQDKPAVIRSYRAVASGHGGTAPGTEAKRRAALIEKGEMHPHPDKTYAKKEEVASTASKWEEAKAKYEELLAAGRYAEALAHVPQGVDDPEGKLTEESRFWKTLATDLITFRAELRKAVMGMAEGSRSLRLEKGPAKVREATEVGFHVEVGTEIKTVPWAEVPPDALAILATRAFAGKEPRLYALLAAYAFGHKQRNLFASAMLTAQSSGSLPKDVDRQLNVYYERSEDRFR